MKTLENLKIKYKLTLVIQSVMMVPLLIGMFIIYNRASQELISLSKTDLDHIVENVLNMCKAQQELLELKVESDLNVANDMLNSKGKLSVDQSKLIDVKAVNQVTKEVVTVSLPTWHFGNQKIHEDFTIVDDIQKLIGGTCTIFQKIQGNHFLRISTNVKKTDGSRAVYTYIPSDSPVAKHLLQGQVYKGRAFVVNQDYITCYKPITDQSYEIVGAIYVGIPVQSAKSLKNHIQSIVVGRTGFVFCVDTQGKLVVHKKEEGANWQDQEFIQHMIQTKNGFYEYQSPLTHTDKVVSYRYFEPWDWIIVASTFEDEFTERISSVKFYLFVIIGVFFIFGCFLSFGIAKKITKPILIISDHLKQVAEGDLTHPLTITQHDELGEMSQNLNSAVQHTHDVIKKLAQTTHNLSTSSKDMQNVANEMTSTANQSKTVSENALITIDQTSSSIKNMAAAAEEVSSQADLVASSSNEASNNIKNIRDAIDPVSISVNTIAAAIEQMYATLNEVSRHSSRGAHVTNDAADKASQTSDIVNRLSNAAKEIGDVVDLIKGIAAQTNLLALNATIEAAGAGVAGKGFAVVANEVKELARQTAKATEQIQNKIQGMQSNTLVAIQAIEKIVSVINEINSIMTTIASSVEEQTATTNEISKNITQTASATKSVSNNVQDAVNIEMEVSMNINDVAKAAVAIAKDAADASVGTDKIRENMLQVNNAINIASNSSGQIHTKADELAQLVEQFHLIIKQFKISV
ncbi:MAG: methyl-accepting chemotaxis protein [Desulfobacterales bacterium]|nr:methyl-accepting chemotaxis protein [Desulfobacterales bacterium]